MIPFDSPHNPLDDGNILCIAYRLPSYIDHCSITSRGILAAAETTNPAKTGFSQARLNIDKSDKSCPAIYMQDKEATQQEYLPAKQVTEVDSAPAFPGEPKEGDHYPQNGVHDHHPYHSSHVGGGIYIAMSIDRRRDRTESL